MPEQFKKIDKREEETREEETVDEKELKERLERLKSLARVIGEDFDMKVEIGKKPGWRYIFKPVNKIEVDPNDIKERGIDYCFGVIAHEGAHRKISRVDFIPKRIWQERGFSFLMNAIEDPRVNNWVSEKYEGAKDWLEEVYKMDLSMEEKISKTSKEKIGYVPKHIQFGLEVIRYWHTGRFSENLPKDVKEALEKTIKYAELAYQTIPETIDPSEEEITEAAKRAYQVIYSAIWPEYQRLVDKAFEDEKIRQLIKEMAENGEIEIPPEGMSDEISGEPLPLDEMPEDLRKKLQKKIKEKLDSMSEEERKKLEESAEKKAEEALDSLEEDLNKELKGKFSEQPETKMEEKKRKEKEEEEKKRMKELEKALKEIEEKLEREKTEYQKAYEAVKQYIDKVAEDLINLFVFERWPRFRKSFPGQRLRLKGAFKYEATKDYRELFERRLKKERRNFAFLLLVDLSSSMRGKKIEETFKGVVLFAEALEKVGSVLGNLKIAIYGFQDDIIKYKDFDESLNDNIREEMNLMKREVYDKGKHNKANYNNDGYCLAKASEILRETGSTNQFLFVLSDGIPEGDREHHLPGYSKATEEEELLAVVKSISEKNDQKILGIGLGPGTDHVQKFYSKEFKNVDNLPDINIEELVEQLASKLKELIK